MQRRCQFPTGKQKGQQRQPNQKTLNFLHARDNIHLGVLFPSKKANALIRTNGEHALDDIIYPLRNEKARQAEAYQPCGNPCEPCEIALVLLPRYPDVHAPQTRDDIHGEDDGA